MVICSGYRPLIFLPRSIAGWISDPTGRSLYTVTEGKMGLPVDAGRIGCNRAEG